jgi:ankyrin repeat protein
MGAIMSRIDYSKWDKIDWDKEIESSSSEEEDAPPTTTERSIQPTKDTKESDGNSPQGGSDDNNLPLNADDLDMMRDYTPPEWDLLLSATAKNELDVVRELLRIGVPATHSNGVGQSALHVAVLWGHMECAKLLLRAGADPNAANRIAGMTPLHTALTSSKTSFDIQYEVVLLLLDGEEGADDDGTTTTKADPCKRDSFGKYPADYIAPNHTYRTQLLARLKKPKLDRDQLRNIFLTDMKMEAPTCRKAS